MMKRILTSLLALLSCISLFGQWVQTNGPEGVKTYDTQMVGDQIWAATEAGVFISFNEGVNWSLGDFLPPESSVRNIFVAGNEIIMSVAVFDNSSSSWDYFLFRSTDLGMNWASSGLPNTGFGNGKVALFKVDNSIFYSRSSLIFRSDDNGLIWQEIFTPEYVGQIASNGEQLLISSYFVSFISNDYGESWAFLDSIGTQSELFMESSLILIETVYDSIHISEDMGLTWTVIPSPGGYGSGSIFRRGASGKLYFMNSLVYVSEDNGFTWDALNTSSPNYATANDVLELSTGERLYGSDRGIYKTSNNGSLWYPSSTDIIGSNIYEMKTLPNGDIITYTNLGYFRSPNGGDNWFSMDISFYLPSFKSILEKEDSLFIASSNGTILLSTDNLNTVDSIASGPANGSYKFEYVNGRYYLLGHNSFYSDDLENWNSLIIDDPNNSNVGAIDDILHTEDDALLATTDDGSVYRSVDTGANWTQVLAFWSPGVTDNFLYEINNQFFLIDDDDWFYSTDNGLTWTASNMVGFPLGQFEDLPTRIAIIGNIIFAVVPSHGVYISTDTGQTWQADNSGLVSLRSRSILYTDERIYLGTETSGIWRRGAAFESVGGFVYHDLNNSGSQDSGELPFADILIKTSPSNTYTSTNHNGLYSLYAEVLNDTIQAIPPSPYTIVQPTYYLATQSASDLDFGLYLIPDMDDLCISLTNIEPFRPGFDNQLVITVKNVGTTALSPSVKLHVNNGLTFLNASPGPTQIDLDTLIWELPILSALSTTNILIDVNLEAGTDIGTYLTIHTEVSPFLDDQNVLNNIYDLRTEVVGSYDPNDKQVEPLGNFTPEQVANGEQLIYTVRFQNTGSYFAQHVRIIDTLNEKLNLASFNMLSASHPVEWNVRGENILEFVFENILLPDSTSNEAASHGFVKFSIKPKEGLSLGDEIHNFADIYFDFNEAVRTNTTSTIFDINTAVSSKVGKIKLLNISPNPANGQCYLSVNNGVSGTGIFGLYDGKGRLIRQQSIRIGATPATIQLDDITPGFYTTTLFLAGELYSSKIIIQ